MLTSILQITKPQQAVFLGKVDVGDESKMDEPMRQGLIISKICSLESLIEHSPIIIDLLTKAYEHFKQQRATRMILHIASLMAGEYFDSQNYGMAKK